MMIATASWLFGREDYASRTIQTGKGPSAVLLADLNGDRKDEIIVTAMTEDTLWIISSLPPVVLSTLPGPTSPIVRNLTGDGSPKIIISTNFDNHLQIFGENRRGTSILPQRHLSSQHGPVAIDTTDLDHNGFLDLISANLLAGNIRALLQDGGQKFRPSHVIAQVDSPTCVAARDFNKDGLVDLAVTSSSPGDLLLFFRKPDGNFQSPRVCHVGDRPAWLDVADFNSDGIPDIAVALNSFNGAAVVMSRAGPTGSFEDARPLLLPAPSNSVAAGDLNGDGLPDLVFSQPTIGKIAILYGEAKGSFSRPVLKEVGKNPTSVAIGDVNGDGKADIACANLSDNTVTLFVRQ